MSRKALRASDYLGHILEAIERIERYTEGGDFEVFAGSEMAQDAVIRNLEVIGEACRNIERGDAGFATRHPDFPLRAAVEMRNVLAHGYFGVDLEIVWRTVRTRLPELARLARRIMSPDPDDA